MKINWINSPTKRTIYKRDSKGKIRFINFEVTPFGELIRITGIKDEPSSYVRHLTACHAKNIGKKNETTAIEQAKLTMNRSIKSKIKGEYFENIADIDIVVIGCMTAKRWKEGHKRIKVGQTLNLDRKYDGMRCITHVKNSVAYLESRDFNDIMKTTNGAMKHIQEQMSKFPDGIYDGELFNMELGCFQKQMKAIKKYREGISEKVNYNIYDMINDDIFDTRKAKINLLIQTSNQPNIKSVETKYYHVVSDNINDTSMYDHIKSLHDQYVKEGYEGLMIRVGDCPYEMNKRSFGLLKLKVFFDTAAEIIDIIPQDSDPKKGQPICRVLKAEDELIVGKEFRTGLAVDHDEQFDMLKNPQNYIGKIAEIRHFGGSDDGIPRHAYYHGLRLDKSK